jgi:aspartate kinase
MLVLKFGGSSLESAAAVNRVTRIVKDRLGDRPGVVVVSAMGKTTDRLLEVARLCEAGRPADAGRAFAGIRKFHADESRRMVEPEVLNQLFGELEQTLVEVSTGESLTPRLWDAVASFGERLSSAIVTGALRQAGVDAVLLDARTVIVTDEHHMRANPLMVETNALLRRAISTTHVTVMGGFIGSTEAGIPSTLGRGGSDYTAAIVGAAIGADEIQIWTDVDGMLCCDPRLVPEARCLKQVSYREAEELARGGAKVLHPATVAPAVWQRIPISIRNSRNPSAPGTVIEDNSPSNGAVLAIACRRNVALLHVSREETPATAEFGRQIWETLQRAGVAFELVSPAVRKFSLAVDEELLSTELMNQLNAIAHVDVNYGCATVVLVGNGAGRDSRSMDRAWNRLMTLGANPIPTCSSECRFGFAIDGEKLTAAVRELHDEFFSAPDPLIVHVGRNLPGPAHSIRQSSVSPRLVPIKS